MSPGPPSSSRWSPSSALAPSRTPSGRSATTSTAAGTFRPSTQPGTFSSLASDGDGVGAPQHAAPARWSQRTPRCKPSGPPALVTEERRCRHPRMRNTSGQPHRARPVRRSSNRTLPAGFTLRSCTKEPKDSTPGKGIDHWPSQLRRRGPRCDPDPARLDKPAATRS
jgi:hypothetical protein